MSPTPLDQQLNRWLRAHHSIISRSEAFALGAGPYDIRCRIRRAQWALVRGGIYKDASAAPTPYQPLRVAFLALHGRALASHGTAAWLWGWLPAPSRLEFTVHHRNGDGPRGDWITHRSRGFEQLVAATRQTILVTNPLRTLVDLAGCSSSESLSRAVDNAIASRLVTVDGLTAEVGRLACQGRRGVAALRRHLLARGFIGAPAPSVLEAKLHRLVVGAGLPLPETEHTAEAEGRFRLDIAWTEIRLAVEVDGYAWHFSPEQTAHDNARRNRLRIAGWHLLVYTWLDVVHRPAQVAAEITAAYQRLSKPAGTEAAG